MLEEALPLVIGVAVAMLPCLAFGSLAATRSFIFLGSEESGVLKALEEGKSEEAALAGATIATPYEPYMTARGLLARMPFAAGASEVVPARMAVAAPATYGFAARHVQ